MFRQHTGRSCNGRDVRYTGVPPLVDRDERVSWHMMMVSFPLIRQRPRMHPCLAPVPYLLLYLTSFEIYCYEKLEHLVTCSFFMHHPTASFSSPPAADGHFCLQAWQRRRASRDAHAPCLRYRKTRSPLMWCRTASR